MNWSTRLIFILVLLLGLPHIATAQVTAEWTQGSWGVKWCGAFVCAQTVSRSFHVTSGSGYIDFVGTLIGGKSTTVGTTTQTTRMWVEEGNDYEIGLSIEPANNNPPRSVSSGTTCYQVKFDSSAFSTPFLSEIGPYPSANFSTLYCFDAIQIEWFHLNASDGKFKDRVHVTWREIDGANTYRVFRCVDHRSNSCGTLIGQTADNSFDDFEGANATTYWYRVKSCTPSGCSDFSLADEGYRDEDADEFQVNASDGTFSDHVQLTWNEIDGANTYRVFRCVDEETSSCGTLIGQTTSNGFNDSEGANATTYWYRVKSCSPSGCSDFSIADTGYRLWDDHGDTCAEATPVDPNSTTPGEFETFGGDQDFFQIILPTAGSLTVKSLGAANTHGTLFDSDCNEIARNLGDGEEPNFRIQKELAAGTYYVDVNSYYTHYKGPYEFVSSFGDPSALPGPTSVSASDGAFTDRVRVTWDSVGAATHYEVYRCTNNIKSSCGSPLGSPVDTSFDHMGGKAETTYWYRVKACSAITCSPFSAADSGYVGPPTGIEDCDQAFVQLDNETLVLNVAPTGLDDTINIQCALDTAANTGVPTVRLDAGTYYISKLMVENFKGTFEGKTKTATKVEVIDGSINCEAMNDSGRESAAIKFVKGEPRIRFMTIRANQPCLSGSIDSILDFTGGSAQAEDCDKDVIFAVADRVIIDGTSIDNGMVAAVSIQPEGKWLGGCKDTLLGTFKLNRSKITNTFFGLVTSLKAGAQIDINFNEFRDNIQAVSLYDTNQNTTITTNKFFGDNTADNSYYGILVSNFSDDPPPLTRMVVHNNEFNIFSSSPDRGAYAVSVVFGDRLNSHTSSLVTSNQFNMSGATTYAVLFENTSNTHIASNRFNGSGGRAIYIYGDTPVSGWTISANKGLADFTSAFVEDIRLSSNTSYCIIGPGQGASVRDDGTDNTILPQ